MAKLHKGCVLDQMGRVDHVLVCTSSAVRSNGELVALEGALGKLAHKHLTIPMAMGKFVREAGTHYYLRCETKVGMFQNEQLPKNGPDLGIISEACNRLVKLAKENPGKTYAVEWPGRKEPTFLFDGFMRQLKGCDNVEVWQE